jgi:outer membrane protein assembly factor BamB
MKLRAIETLLPTVTAIGGVTLILLWQISGPPFELGLRLGSLDLDGAPAQVEPPVDIKGFFIAGSGIPVDLPGSWTGFRGPDRDGINREAVRLIRSFPEDIEQRVLWSLELGEGYAGAAIIDGKVFILDYDQQAQADTLRCLSLLDGKEVWRRGYHLQVKRNHGMSRTVPGVTEDFVVTLGPKCHVMCTDARTGEFLWGMDLPRRYGTRVPEWYAGQCPLIDDQKAIIAPCSEALMIAVHCPTGEVLWETPNPYGWEMTHSSVTPVEVDGVRVYVYCASGGVAGVSADTGEILWASDKWTVNMANVPSPIDAGDGKVFLCGGYGSGGMMIRIAREGDKFTAEELFRLKPQVFASEQQTPVLYRKHIYGVRDNGELICLDLDGNVIWTSGRTNRFGRKGRGPIMIADGLLLILTTDGVLSMVDPSPEGFRKLGEARVLLGGEAWGPMAMADGRLLLRDLTRMICLDMRSERMGGP